MPNADAYAPAGNNTLAALVEAPGIDAGTDETAETGTEVDPKASTATTPPAAATEAAAAPTPPNPKLMDGGDDALAPVRKEPEPNEGAGNAAAPDTTPEPWKPKVIGAATDPDVEDTTGAAAAAGVALGFGAQAADPGRTNSQAGHLLTSSEFDNRH